MNRYVLITPAHNEAGFIGETIRSVQTIRPLRWVIVNDGSVDQTHQTVKSLVTRQGFVEMLSNRESGWPGLEAAPATS